MIRSHPIDWSPSSTASTPFVKGRRLPFDAAPHSIAVRRRSFAPRVRSHPFPPRLPIFSEPSDCPSPISRSFQTEPHEFHPLDLWQFEPPLMSPRRERRVSPFPAQLSGILRTPFSRNERPSDDATLCHRTDFRDSPRSHCSAPSFVSRCTEARGLSLLNGYPSRPQTNPTPGKTDSRNERCRLDRTPCPAMK